MLHSLLVVVIVVVVVDEFGFLDCGKLRVSVCSHFTWVDLIMWQDSHIIGNQESCTCVVCVSEQWTN